MSTSYDIRCMDSDCAGASTNLDDCRYSDVLQSIIGEHRASLENCGSFLQDPKTWWFTHMPDKLQHVLLFLAEHHGHRLAVFDEYGKQTPEDVEAMERP